MEQRKKPRFSRIMCVISTIIFMVVLGCGIYTTLAQGKAFTSMDLSFYAYAIPATGAVTAAVVGFNLNYQKAKKVCKEKLIFIKELYNLKKELGIFDAADANILIDNEAQKAQDSVINSLTQQEDEANQPTDIHIN